MEDVFKLIADVGAPIAGSLVMGVFIFIVIKQSDFKDHQIDLIDMDQQNQEIDEDVLEIPAFLRRQAN